MKVFSQDTKCILKKFIRTARQVNSFYGLYNNHKYYCLKHIKMNMDIDKKIEKLRQDQTGP